jgi:hypothetical protein
VPEDHHFPTRLSHKVILDQQNINERIKRRISTAGTSKRFPKDFFKLDEDKENQHKPVDNGIKGPIFKLKVKRETI